MKYYLYFLFFLSVIQIVSCKSNGSHQTANSDLTSIEIEGKSYDFGTISQSDSVSHIFQIRNTGNIPLVIKSVKAGCGCTIPRWDSSPVTPGQYASVEVTYKPTISTEGFVTKSIVVQTNTDSTFHVLYITGNVEKKS